MTKETLLMQYQSECLSALKSIANIHKPFEKTFMDTMKLFMAIPDRINFLQLGRYGCFSEQTYLASHSYTMLICLNDLFACSGLTQTHKLLTNFSKNSFYLLPEPLRLGDFLTNY